MLEIRKADVPEMPPFAASREILAGVRILFVIGGSAYGGVVPLLVSLSRGLRAAGAEVVLEASDPRVLEYLALHQETVQPVRPWARRIAPWTDLRYGAGLYRLLRRQRFHLVHTHTSKANFVGRMAAWLAGVPAVVHCHNLYYLLLPPGPKRLFYKALERIAGRFQELIIFPDEELREVAIRDRIVSRQGSVVIRNAVPGDGRSGGASPGELRRELNLSGSDFVVCHVGRLAPSKNVELLLRAWLQPPLQQWRPYLVLAGEGEERSRLERLARQWGLLDRVYFLGFRRDIPQILAASNLFVTASLWEGQPMAILEAMAAGLPIVAPRIKGIRGVVRDGQDGILVEPNSVAELAEAIGRLLGDRELAQRFGRSGAERVSQAFSEKRMIEQTIESYRRILANQSSPAPGSGKERAG